MNMIQEVKMSEHDGNNRVSEWELGLPTADDLTPLSQTLISPDLAAAFNISPEISSSTKDVNHASQNTLSSIQLGQFQFIDEPDLTCDGLEMRKSAENGNDESSAAARMVKRPRLVWTPQLHKRFVEVVAHLGIKSAVPKTIMQLMNVEGLTRENVASHLQKYRLYLRRIQGLSEEDGPPSSSDHLFASTPVPQSLREQNGGDGRVSVPVTIPMAYPPQQQLMHMPPLCFPGHGYNTVQQRNKFGSVASYQRVTTSNNNDKC